MTALPIVGLIVAVLIVIVLLIALRQMVNIVQQGQVGVVKRLGEYRFTHEPGPRHHLPFIDSLQRVDMREIPVPGDRQDVITRDNVVVTVNATIFTQVVDASRRCSASRTSTSPSTPWPGPRCGRSSAR
jgi:regulator of protease activity HflC (stomatin/prohibitin superfamily)